MHLVYIFYLVFIFLASSLYASGLTPLSLASQKDTVCNIWVHFTDKNSSDVLLTKRALARRKAAGYNFSSNTDFPVNKEYIKSIEQLGGKLRHEYKWENVASFSVSSKKIDEISKLFFVKSVELVQTYKRKSVSSNGSLQKKMLEADSVYSLSYDQLKMGSIIQAHEYMKIKGMAEPGSGVLMALFDSRFRFDHACFEYMKVNKLVKATRDFVDNGAAVFDQDLIYNDSACLNSTDDHGMKVLSSVAGHDVGSFMGAAWGAQFVLARTEDVTRETHIEEDNWVAALVWAESLGVDIVSSSLGYRGGFCDSVVIERDGKSETVVDYLHSDIDGKTTIVSRAASMAVQRGLLIVNAAGNEGTDENGTLTSPADVDGVIAVGAVNTDSKLAWYSSTGPTYDGRMKPDLVHLGNVTIAVPSSPSNKSYSQVIGTSFSTPLVSGICALIMQSHSELQPSQVRERLYKYCTLSPFQKSVDNKYGRGIPNAVLSCMSDNEAFIKVKDTLGNVLPNVLIENQLGDSIGITNYDGSVLLKIAKTPADLGLVFWGKRYSLSVSATPFYNEFIINDSGSVSVSLRNKKGEPVVGSVFIKFDGEKEFIERHTDTLGTINVGYYKETDAQIYAKSSGYKVSDTVNVSICLGQCSEEILMEKIVLNEIPISQFQLYPSIIKRDVSLKVKFILESGGPIDLSIRTIDGGLVWKRFRLMEPYEPFELVWDCRTQNGKRIVPGIYFFIIRYDGKVYKKKFIISV